MGRREGESKREVLRCEKGWKAQVGKRMKKVR